MSVETEDHLSDDQIIQAVVDEDDLPAPFKVHLSTCPRCRAEKARLEGDLAFVGQLARRSAPVLQRPMALTAGRPKALQWAASWPGRMAVGLAVSAGLVLLLIGSGLLRLPYPAGVQGPAVSPSQSDRLMAEVTDLVENPLPPVYQDMCGEPLWSSDEGFLQFIVPSTNSDPLSHDVGKKGVGKC